MISRKISLLVLCSWIGMIACPGLFAAPKNLSAKILANLGGINTTGLPRLVLLHNNTHELTKMGFGCSVAHKTIVATGGHCRTEWLITGLRTCIYFDQEQNLIWARPSLQVETLYEKQNYSDKSNRFTAKIQGNSIEIHLTNGQQWFYVDGYLKSISDPTLGTIEFETDKELVLLAAVVSPAGERRHLLKIEYSDSGLLKSMTMAQKPPVVFGWSIKGDLVQIRNLGSKDYHIAYTDALISEWQCSDGRNGSYVWTKKGSARLDSNLGRASMRLKEDASYLYTYGQSGGLDYIVVKDKTGNFVSKTHISNRGVIQHTANGTLKAIYRTSPNGTRQLVEP